MSVWRRLCRILDQDRIRLPIGPRAPSVIRSGDRLQIGLEIWRVCRTWTPSGSRIESFVLQAEEASVRTALLVAPGAIGGFRDSTWTLIKGHERLEVPGEMIVAFPSGLVTSHSDGRRRS